MEFPKPLQDQRGQYKVYLHAAPDVGDLFWSMTGRGKEKTVQHFRVQDVAQYKSKLRGGMATRITWEDQSGNLFTSGMRSKSMTKANKSQNCSGGDNA